ncbi:pathogenesis-related protein 1 [Marchantia polymorpha subsp. ruderalis]|uniref:SCP domain-containing protein n=2 Tax=Marchantia polymorpha TaxID=3197 RepID=A0A176VBE3_MARPO|nr:hypothetical protein AXG93_406s1220 [Marchantia polymorpha subsp. ruderalis]PTQ30964.1 hypothetical protein MARPO_0117s0024 [Marchantia polymorpha]BBN12019.1 hypothetical protein Mp_5g16820 [Marchantia polymorpha subsp. ruderalis]|eukprot:PTQ30964.1 hypothetical protein MARPO_0117s0024 [Marchantia polymorpha]
MDRRLLSLVLSSWLVFATLLSSHCHATRDLVNEVEPRLELVSEGQLERHEMSGEAYYVHNLGDEASDYVNPHNSARRVLNANIPDLTWSSTLANYAKNWAQTRANAGCNLIHSGGSYGENIYWSSWQSVPGDAVKSWVDEKQYYNYNSNSCASGQVCGHYTQVVWRNTQRVGCGSATCAAGGKFVVCSYDPPGNYIGQKPY